MRRGALVFQGNHKDLSDDDKQDVMHTYFVTENDIKHFHLIKNHNYSIIMIINFSSLDFEAFIFCFL